MASQLPSVPHPAHYPTPVERSADQWVHIVGIAAAAVGGLILLGLSLGLGAWTETLAIAAYASCLVATFLCSALYNLSGPRLRPLFRRLDLAAIFLMIAGSYTPFTTQRLHGAWALYMTLAVWLTALGGALGQIFLPGLGRKFWIGLYLALGWLAIIAVKPLIAAVSAVSLTLLLIGGLVYSTGVLVYIRRQLKYRHAVWHGFVLTAAATHYAAILTGVVLLPAG
ncbi:MAG: hemolysin III family protein [Caulobacterales bacterium]